MQNFQKFVASGGTELSKSTNCELLVISAIIIIPFVVSGYTRRFNESLNRN